MSLKYICTALLIVIVATQAFSQDQKNLYLFYNKDSPTLRYHRIYENDEVMAFDITLINCDLRSTITVGNNGRISSVNPRSVSRFSLSYINIKHNNDTVLVPIQKTISRLYVNMMTEFISGKNWFNLTNQFDNIYVVDENEKVFEFYVARKVEVNNYARL